MIQRRVSEESATPTFLFRFCIKKNIMQMKLDAHGFF